MRITVTPDGEVHIDTNGSTPAEIAGLILSVQRELRGEATTTRAQRGTVDSDPQPHIVTVTEPVAAQAEVSLPPGLWAAWSWLVENDTPRGHNAVELCNGLGLGTPRAAAQRLRKLAERGVAHRVKAGRYRAGEGA